MKLNEILYGIEKKDILLPEFQREYVWNREQSKQLMVSLFKNYPIGAFLLWKTENPPEIKNNAINSEKIGTYSLILDGQQRLTTLYLLIKNEIPPYYKPNDILNNPDNLYFNLKSGEFKYFQPIMKNNLLWQKLTDCFSLQKKVNVIKIAKKISEKNSQTFNTLELVEKLNENLNNLRNIRNRGFPIEYVPNNAQIDDAIDIFDKVNRQGTKLTDAELALTHITGKWPQARRIFKIKIKELKEINFLFDLRFIVRCLTGIVRGRALFDTIHNAVKEEVMEGWKKLDKILDYVITILPKHAYIHSTEDINTTNILVPFIVYLSKNPNLEFDSKKSMKKAIRWLYLAHLWTRYSGQTDQKLDQDINIVLRNLDPWDDLIDVIIDQRGRIKLEASNLEGRGIGNPVFNMLYIVEKAKGAIDWTNGSPIDITHGKAYKIHKHHIFPSSVLYNEKYDSFNHLHKKLVNEIANRAFLTATSNISKIRDRKPVEYLPQIINKYGEEALKNQLIPMNQELWTIDNYERFLKARRKIIAEEINKFINTFWVEEKKIKKKRSLLEYINTGESTVLEFKSSSRWDYYQEKINKELNKEITKTIAGFMNSEGGTLLIGVNDDGEIVGIENDVNTLNKKNLDGYGLHLNSIISSSIGPEYTPFISIRFDKDDEKEVCIIEVESSTQPIFIKNNDRREFYIRQGNSTRLLDSEETHKFIEIKFNF